MPPQPTDTKVARLAKGSSAAWNMADAMDWQPLILDSTAANNSDLTFTVTAGKQWIPISIALTYVASSGSTLVANSTDARQVEVQYRSTGNNVLYCAIPGVASTFSSTRSYFFTKDSPDLTAFRDIDKLTTPLAEIMLASGCDIRVFDNKTRHSTGDDLTVRLTVLQRDNPTT